MTQIIVAVKSDGVYVVGDSLYRGDPGFPNGEFAKVFRHADAYLVASQGYAAGSQIALRASRETTAAAALVVLKEEWQIYKAKHQATLKSVAEVAQIFHVVRRERDEFLYLQLGERADGTVGETEATVLNPGDCWVIGPSLERESSASGFWVAPQKTHGIAAASLADWLHGLPNAPSVVDAFENALRAAEASSESVALPARGWQLRKGTGVEGIGPVEDGGDLEERLQALLGLTEGAP